MGSATIIQRTISAATETAVQLTNAAFARQCSIPSGWNTIRVGVRAHWTNNGGAGLASTPRFGLGFCKGVTNILGGATCDHFVGVISTQASWTNQVTFFGGNTMAPAKKVGTTLTVGSNYAGIAVMPNKADSATADREVFFVDILKGSPNYTISLFCGNSGTLTDISSASFLSQMQLASPSLGSHASAGSLAIAVDEAANGVLDAVNVWWDHADSLCEICDIAVVRLT